MKTMQPPDLNKEVHQTIPPVILSQSAKPAHGFSYIAHKQLPTIILSTHYLKIQSPTIWPGKTKKF